MKLLPAELCQLLILVLVVGLVVVVASLWIPLQAKAEPEPYTWPQVTRVIHPEDLDRCGG